MLNILPALLKKVLTQGGNFSYRKVILHRTVWKPDLSGMRLVFKNLPPQQEVGIWTLPKISFILSNVGCVKMLWINRQPKKILMPFPQESRLHWKWYLLMWWTKLSSPWARESRKLSNEKDKELNSSFVFTCS